MLRRMAALGRFEPIDLRHLIGPLRRDAPVAVSTDERRFIQAKSRRSASGTRTRTRAAKRPSGSNRTEASSVEC
jgi:hypothetical protein